MRRKIIITCGGAAATPTMTTEEIKELCQNHSVPVELTQCRVNKTEIHMDSVHLIRIAAKVGRNFGGIPLVHGMPLIPGIDIEVLQGRVLTVLQG